MSNRMRGRAFLCLSLATVLTAACGAGASPATPSSSPAPTDPPTPTATPVPSITPTPSRTPTPTVNAEATQSARATATFEARLADMEADLHVAGITAAEGHVAWANFEPLEVNSTNYGFMKYYPIGEEKDYADFVYHTSVTWDTSTGLAGCGVIFRSEPDLANGEQFIFMTMRLSGAPFWDVELWKYQQPQSSLTGGLKANGAIHVEARSTNEMMLVAQSHQLTAYANGSRLGAVTILRRSEGRMAVLAWQESGYATCTYGDSWIWVPGPADREQPQATT